MTRENPALFGLVADAIGRSGANPSLPFSFGGGLELHYSPLPRALLPFGCVYTVL